MFVLYSHIEFDEIDKDESARNEEGEIQGNDDEECLLSGDPPSPPSTHHTPDSLDLLSNEEEVEEFNNQWGIVLADQIPALDGFLLGLGLGGLRVRTLEVRVSGSRVGIRKVHLKG